MFSPDERRMYLTKISSLLILWLTVSGMAAPAKRLKICPQHPYYFRDGDQHIVLVGVSDRALFNIWKNDKGFSWQKYLDDIAAHHLNYVRQDVFSWGAIRGSLEYPAQLSNSALVVFCELLDESRRGLRDFQGHKHLSAPGLY